MPVEKYKNLVLLVVILTVVGLWLVVKLWPYGKHRTFSQHVARHRSAILYYIALFAVILPLLMLYIFRWLIPTYHPFVLYGIFMSLAAVSQFACTLVPETGGRKTVIHQYLAFFSADCLLPATFILAVTPSISIFGRLIALIASTVMAILIAVFVKSYSKHQFEHDYLLIIQASYFALFFLALLAVTYL